MEGLATVDFLLAAFRSGWRRWAAWSLCVGAIVVLGAIRTGADAELAFASLALLPVLLIAWIDGKRNGLVMAFLATSMWAVADFASERQFSAAWIPWANAATRMMTYALVVLLTAKVRAQFEQEHENATRDSLTGLQNRRGFLDAGSGEVERSRRYVLPLTVVFLDLDNFKQLNDSKGHAAGDSALKAAADALVAALRSSDRVARLGGDEFAVLLPEIGYDDAVDTGRKIAAAVNGALQRFPPVRASVGLAWFEGADRAFAEMLKEADKLMYQVKASGKDGMRSRSFDATGGRYIEAAQIGRADTG